MHKDLVCWGLLALCALWIPAAAAADTAATENGQRDAAFAEAQQAYDEGRYNDALAALKHAFRQDPANLDINFLMGMAAIRTGDYETAATAFDRALAMRPDLDRVKLELARSYYHLRLYSVAERLFREVLAEDDVPEGVKSSVRTVLDRIAAENRRHKLTGALVLSISRDSNARVSPDGGIDLPGLPTLAVPVERDWFFSQSLILEHTFRPDTQSMSWFTSLLNYNAFYFDVDDLDVNYYRAATGPRWRDGHWSAGLDAVAGYMHRDYDRYLRTLGGEIWGACRVAPSAALRLNVLLEDRRYYSEPDRNAFFGQIGLRPAITTGPWSLDLLAAYEFNNADGDWEAYDRLLAGMQLSRRLPLRIVAFVGYDYEYTLYDEPDPLTGVRRKDDLHQVYAGLRKTFGAHVAVELVHRYEKSLSNSDLYDYDRNLSTLSLTVAF
jgi:Tfp pilus assembly protein PilF